MSVRAGAGREGWWPDAGDGGYSALCHIAPTLLTRIIACWRAGVPYQVRDTGGTPLTAAQGRAVVAERYRVSDELRARRRITLRRPAEPVVTD